MKKTSSLLTVHVINHTHWDREWFLTHIYTRTWIPRLIDRLDELVARNPDFRYLLDGQTLIVEDLLSHAPQYAPKIRALVGQGNLLIGPYYCQPDWKLTGGEALVRNLLYGHQDAATYGGRALKVGWLVDTFGHISQAPQLHRLFDIETVYVWRGVPLLTPYFSWYSPDQSHVVAMNLLGGYRNLYGVTHVPEVATRRVEVEARHLQPHYPTPDIPLFDGYDLEDNPEDPVTFFVNGARVPPGIILKESSPEAFARVATRLKDLPVIEGELNSGKYAAVFPGTLSARTYLKVMAYDCDFLLFRVCEPLAALASLFGRDYPAQRYETWARHLLQNAVHDCICGVSVDLVHEKMEWTYRQIFEEIKEELADSLSYLLHDFAPGLYAVSTNPYVYEGWHVLAEHLYHVRTEGVGVWPLEEGIPVEWPNTVTHSFSWRNGHYTAVVREDGTVQVGKARLGALLVYQEQGDAYSEERGDLLGACEAERIIVEERSSHHAVLHISYRPLRVTSPGGSPIEVSVTVRLHFDPSPIIRWTVDVDSRGTDFRLEMLFDTGRAGGQINAGMPFDVTTRPTEDKDLLPRVLEPDLEGLLMGQREIGVVRVFPFRDFVAVSDETGTSAVFTRGLHSYEADERGSVRIMLRRSIEWLTRPDLPHRVGDAGPRFYVPDAREERRVRHELGFVAGEFSVTDPRFQALRAAYHNPPLLVRAQGRGSRVTWSFYRADLPLDSLHRRGDKILARVHNPARAPHVLQQARPMSDPWGRVKETTRVVPPKKIATLVLATASSPVEKPYPVPVQILTPLAWRVGPNHGSPDPTVISELKQKAVALETQLKHIEDDLKRAKGCERYRLRHRYYILRRELYEYLLATRLNEVKLRMGGMLSSDYLFRPQEDLMALGVELNRMRIKRRIYDYVVQVCQEADVSSSERPGATADG